jgi:hypothetical protein
LALAGGSALASIATGSAIAAAASSATCTAACVRGASARLVQWLKA